MRKYTIIYIGENEATHNMEEKYFLIYDSRKTLMETIKKMKMFKIEIVEVFRTNNKGINTSINF